MENKLNTLDGDFTEEELNYLETLDPHVKKYILELHKLLKEHKTKLQLLEVSLQNTLATNLQLQQENKNINKELLSLKAVLKPNVRLPTTPTIEAKPPTIDDDGINKANCILIKNLNQNTLIVMSKAREMIKLLARQMSIDNLKDDDVKFIKMNESKYYKRRNITPDRISLLVEFSCEQIKVDFLKNKEKLKSNELTESLEILDYVSDETYNLYQYAKELLKSKGYQMVYWRNNSVYARRNKSSLCEPIKLQTKQDVDALAGGVADA